MDRHANNHKTKKRMKCSFCGKNEASIILCNNTLSTESANKPLCLLHYYTTRACRLNTTSNKIRTLGNGSELERQKVKVQNLFMEAFDELRKEIAEESVKPSSSSLFRATRTMGQPSRQLLSEKDPLSALFDAPRRRQPLKQKTKQQIQQRPKIITNGKGSEETIDRPTKMSVVKNGATTASRTNFMPRVTVTKHQQLHTTQSQPLPTVSPRTPRLQWQNKLTQLNPSAAESDTNVDSEGGFIRDIQLPKKLLQHQKRQQEDVVKNICVTPYRSKTDVEDLATTTTTVTPHRKSLGVSEYQRQSNPYKRRKTATKSIWSRAIDENIGEHSCSDNLVDFDNEESNGINSTMKASTPCPSCKSDNAVCDGNTMTCRYDDVPKAETWGRKDRSDVALMKCRCLDCGRVWNEDGA
uniref:Uncharacterized protein n=1 Tax=Ditylum brightwellii TaxID=49249 RepID=A0A7S4QGX1_9STRA